MSTPPQGALPLADYEDIPFGSLASRIRSLDIQQLEQLIGYEQIHGERILVLELLEHRRDELRDGGKPTSGDPAARKPEVTTRDASVDAAPGPAVNPPSDGNPTNPPQPR